jgi:hypothetical protein
VEDAARILVRPAPAARLLCLEAEPAGEALVVQYLEAEAKVEQHALIRLRVPENISQLRLRVTGAAAVYRCDWEDSPPSGGQALSIAKAPSRPGVRAWEIATRGSSFLWDWGRGKRPGRIGMPAPRFLKRLGRISPPPACPAALHTNACGDFTLAHRQHWLELRGYPEFDLYSMNLDSVFCYMAHYGGAAEEILPDPMRIYHIEHASGSGWSPEGHNLLFERLAAKGIPWLEFDEVLNWAAQMERLQTTMVFNREDWGLAADDLPETRV